MKLLSFVFKKKKEKPEEKNTKKVSYIFDSVFPSREVAEIAMGTKTEEKKEKDQ